MLHRLQILNTASKGYDDDKLTTANLRKQRTNRTNKMNIQL